MLSVLKLFQLRYAACTRCQLAKGKILFLLGKQFRNSQFMARKVTTIATFIKA